LGFSYVKNGEAKRIANERSADCASVRTCTHKGEAVSQFKGEKISLNTKGGGGGYEGGEALER